VVDLVLGHGGQVGGDHVVEALLVRVRVRVRVRKG